MSDGRPYNTMKPGRRLEEQERRYREAMGAEKAERQKALAEAERNQFMAVHRVSCNPVRRWFGR